MAKTMKYVIGCILLCIVLMCIGTMIPPRWVKPQLRKSIDNFSKQVSYPNVIKEYESSKAGYDGNESFLYKAAANIFYVPGIIGQRAGCLCLDGRERQEIFGGCFI